MPSANRKHKGPFLSGLFLISCVAIVSLAQEKMSNADRDSWRFAVSGDSRNCGDIVMPAIAQGARKDGAQFYWHLGDYRAIYMFDEDYRQLNPNAVIIDYETAAWPDFIAHQLLPFGDLPVYLAVGNHETIPPKTRAELLPQFADWFNSPVIQHQRLADNAGDHLLKTYYHWRHRGVDFITLDNGSADQFDLNQMTWFQTVLKAAAADMSIRTVVVGMHAALPDSLSAGHSMNDSAQEQASGRQVYTQLVNFRRTTKKNVYVLASHSHFVLNNVYATACRAQEDVLPGWVVGTAGAVRYRLPPEHATADVAMTDVYGYLLATVSGDGTISFKFQQLEENDVPADVVTQFTTQRVHWCFSENKSPYVVTSPVCGNTSPKP